MKAVNWNVLENDYNIDFWNINIMQFWTDEEIPLSDDKMDWQQMSPEEKRAFKYALGGLTLLDTKLGGDGMPLVLIHVEGLQTKAIMAWMAMMEQIHAKSYSSIFTTLEPQEEVDKIFEWVENQPQLQAKAGLIVKYYRKLMAEEITAEDLYKAMVASVMLESYLFYSGFYYPLYLAGQGKMTSSGEIIDLILRDESIHGVYVGMKAQELLASFDLNKQEEMKKFTYDLMLELFEHESEYTKYLYEPIGLADDVLNYVRYNANKALMNLGYDAYFTDINDKSFSPIVLNGINTHTKQHDFFSKKGNGYIKTLNIEPITDDDFNFINERVAESNE